MTKRRRAILASLAGFMLTLLCLPWLTLCFIPDATLLQALNHHLKAHGLSISAQKLGRPFPVGISAVNLTLADSNGTWIKLDQLSVRLRLLPLLSGKASISLNGSINTGRLSGSSSIYPRVNGQLVAEQLELGDLPLLSRLIDGGSLTGRARIALTLSQTAAKAAPQGTLKLQVQTVELRKARLSGLQLPDVSCPELRGLLTLKGQTIQLDNLALQGDGIYLRLGGAAPLSAVAPLNLKLELMPTAEFLEKQKSLFLFMLPYQTSPGSYKLPIGGSLSSPRLLSR